jgi:glycosyltransferase involved in cell wall biosynthesis
VLHVYKDVFPPVPGGIEKQIGALRRAMPDVVSNVVVCARGPRTRVTPVDGGLEVAVAEYGPRWLSVPVAPALPRWVGRIGADVIHVHMPYPPGEAAALLARRGRPIVASYHADIVRQARFIPAYRPLVDACLRRSAAVVAATRRLVETSDLLRPHAPKVALIPYGVDVETYRREAADPGRVAEIRRRYGTPLVISVGRLAYYKGHEHLIEAARGLDASVLIVGDGPERERVEALVRGAPNVHLAGEVGERDLVAHLAAADCFVLSSTSRAEAFGIAVTEAQAMSLPAVVTDTGSGTVEAVESGVTGFVAPARDARALRDALAAVLADGSRREAMGRAARERAVSRHSLADRARELSELYRRVAAPTRS